MKKLITTLFALFILSSSAAQAVTLNATKIGGVYTTNPTGAILANAATAFRSLTPMGAAMAIGRVVTVLTLADQLNSLRIQGGMNSGALTPNGWSDASTPPSTTAPVSPYYLNGDYAPYNHFDTPAGTCNRLWAAISPGTYNAGSPVFSGNNFVCRLTRVAGGTADTSTFTYVSSPSSVCYPGYTYSSGVCNLTSLLSAKWPTDNIPTLANTGTSFTPDFREYSDNTGFSTSPTYTRTGTDTFNNPAKETVTTNASGGIDYVRDTQGVSEATGEPLVQRDRFSTDSTGTITHSSTTTYSNSTLNNVNTTSPSGQTTIDTSLLAKDATLQEIKASLNPQTVPDISGADGGIIDLGNNAVSEISGSSTNLTNLPTQNYDPVHFWTYASGQCNPITFDAGRFGVISLSTFCYIYDTYIRAIIVFLLWAAGLYHAYYLWQDTVREMF